MTFNRWLFLIVTLVGSVIGTLAFGSPQWKWCYVTQKHWLKNNIKPPPRFNGTWYEYRKFGVLHKSIQYYNGTRTGMEIIYDDTGNKIATLDWGENKLHGKATEYDSAGKVSHVYQFVDGEYIPSAYFCVSTFKQKGESFIVQMYPESGLPTLRHLTEFQFKCVELTGVGDSKLTIDGSVKGWLTSQKGTGAFAFKYTDADVSENGSIASIFTTCDFKGIKNNKLKYSGKEILILKVWPSGRHIYIFDKHAGIDRRLEFGIAAD